VETLEINIGKVVNFMTSAQFNEDSFCRLAKAIIERNKCSYDEAMQILGGFKLNLVCDAAIFSSISLQAAFLTAINAGKRAFHGGICISMPANVPSLLPWPGNKNLNQIVQELGGVFSEARHSEDTQTLYFGNPENPVGDSLRVIAGGWRGGVSPGSSSFNLESPSDFALGGILAGAIGVAKGFFRVSGLSSRFVESPYGISLWRPDLDWTHREADGPTLQFLPSRVWLLGLGHLGQAYLWTLGLMPYSKTDEASLLLQDFDRVVTANWNAGLLCDDDSPGRYKTRLCAEWLERRGFKTTITERRFDANTIRGGEEPYIALCGFDNPEARSLLERAGFDLVVECGLGASASQFDSILLHTFPEASQKAAQIWSQSQQVMPEPNPLLMEALHGKGDCGIIAHTLAEKAISTSFVGAVASTLAAGELIRGLHGGSRYELIKVDLRSNESVSAVLMDENYQKRLARSGFVFTSGSNLQIR
jgi:hypothetical protein